MNLIQDAVHEALRDAGLEEYQPEYRALLRRDWAVRVLDAWADEQVTRSWEIRRADSSVDVRAACVLRHRRIECHFGSFDAARHAAALAVFPSLDRNAPNWPGECP